MAGGEDQITSRLPFTIEAVDLNSPEAAQQALDAEVERVSHLEGFDEPFQPDEIDRLERVIPPGLANLSADAQDRFIRQIRMTLWAGDALDAMLELGLSEPWQEWLARVLSVRTVAGDRAFVEAFMRRQEYMRELELAAGYFDEPKPKVTLH
jgi:hypothetical protein